MSNIKKVRDEATVICHECDWVGTTDDLKPLSDSDK